MQTVFAKLKARDNRCEDSVWVELGRQILLHYGDEEDAELTRKQGRAIASRGRKLMQTNLTDFPGNFRWGLLDGIMSYLLIILALANKLDSGLRVFSLDSVDVNNFTTSIMVGMAVLRIFVVVSNSMNVAADRFKYFNYLDRIMMVGMMCGGGTGLRSGLLMYSMSPFIHLTYLLSWGLLELLTWLHGLSVDNW